MDRISGRIEDRETPLSARKPNPQHWYNNPIGKTGFELAFILNSRDNELRAELIIRDNTEAYRQLIDQSQQIESEFDRELTWHEPEETRAGKERSRIVVTKSADVTDQDQWDEYLDWMIEHGEQFHGVFYDRIQRL